MKYVYIVTAIDFMMSQNIVAVFSDENLAEQFIKENKDKYVGYELKIMKFKVKKK